ncbi:MAG: hypothetical protein M1840_001795 [Geoglossum simile]|nr:MAG: hypothetical protein M1840_001795 [Geoglossum simile]
MTTSFDSEYVYMGKKVEALATAGWSKREIAEVLNPPREWLEFTMNRLEEAGDLGCRYSPEEDEFIWSMSMKFAENGVQSLLKFGFPARKPKSIKWRWFFLRRYRTRVLDRRTNRRVFIKRIKMVPPPTHVARTRPNNRP